MTTNICNETTKLFVKYNKHDTTIFSKNTMCRILHRVKFFFKSFEQVMQRKLRNIIPS